MEGMSHNKRRNPHESTPMPGGTVSQSGLLKKDGLTLTFRKKFRSDDPARDGAFVELKEKVHPLGQRFFSLILKGIMPIADVEKVTLHRRLLKPREMHVSRIQDLSAAESVDTHEVRALFIILARIFMDTDRGDAYINHNIATRKDPESRDKKKVSIYDLENMVIYFMDQRSNMRPDDFYTAKWTRNYRMENIPLPGIRQYEIERMDPKVVAALEAKLRALEERFAGDDGLRFIGAVVRQLGVPLERAIHFPHEIANKKTPDDEQYYEKAFQDALLNRVRKSLKAIEGARSAAKTP